MNEKGACMQWNRYNLLTEILFFIRGCVCIYIYIEGDNISQILSDCLFFVVQLFLAYSSGWCSLLVSEAPFLCLTRPSCFSPTLIGYLFLTQPCLC